MAYVALLAEGVDRNGYQEAWAEYRMKSPSSRRAWIEIFSSACFCSSSEVALLAEGVDRNLEVRLFGVLELGVALLAEGVDRNFPLRVFRSSHCVALLAEGVDRNKNGGYVTERKIGRPPRGGRG